MRDEQAVIALTELMHAQRLAAAGWRVGAQRFAASRLQAMAEARADECDVAAEDLRAHIADLAGYDRQEPGLRDTLQGVWSRLGTLDAGDDVRIAALGERGERALDRVIDRVLARPLPESERALARTAQEASLRMRARLHAKFDLKPHDQEMRTMQANVNEPVANRPDDDTTFPSRATEGAPETQVPSPAMHDPSAPETATGDATMGAFGGNMHEAMGGARERVQHAASYTRDRARDAMSATQGTIARSPMISMAAVLGAGILIGWLLADRTPTRSSRWFDRIGSRLGEQLDERIG